MKFFKPVPVVDATFISSTIAEPDGANDYSAAAYVAGTTYAVDNYCIYAHNIYKSLQAGNIGHQPDISPTWWVKVAPTNKWRALDQATGTISTSTATIVMKFRLPDDNFVNSIAILDITSVSSVTLKLTDSTDTTTLWEQTFSLQYYGEDVSADWYWYFFSVPDTLDSFVSTVLPYYFDSVLTVTLTKSTSAASCSVGTIAFGTKQDLGDTQWGVKLGILDFSKKETDEFGTTTVLERVYARTMDCSAFLPHAAVPGVYRALSSIRANPVVWVGSDESMFSSTIIYGFYKSFDVVLESAGGSFVSLEIEGLS